MTASPTASERCACGHLHTKYGCAECDCPGLLPAQPATSSEVEPPTMAMLLNQYSTDCAAFATSTGRGAEMTRTTMEFRRAKIDARIAALEANQPAPSETTPTQQEQSMIYETVKVYCGPCANGEHVFPDYAAPTTASAVVPCHCGQTKRTISPVAAVTP